MKNNKQATVPESIKELKTQLDQKNRELEIEAALEKVRIRSLAMHRSQELSEVILEVFMQLKNLGIESHNSGIDIIQENSDDLHMWVATQDSEIPELIITPYIKNSIFDNYIQAKKSKSFLKDQHSKIAKDKFFEHAYNSKALQNISEDHKKIVFDAPGSSRSTYITDHVGFMMSKLDLVPFTDAEDDILIRFAKVFDQSYSRFLDLQIAEAQVRESQIEAALERIRNRSLIMKDSDELNEVVTVFFKEFQQLNLLPPEARTYFCDINAKTDVAEVWMTYINGEVMNGSHQTPLNKSVSMRKYYEAWKRKDPLSIREYKGKSLNNYLAFVSTLPHVKQDKDYKKLFKNPPRKIFMTDANFLQGNIGIMTFSSLSEEACDILIRFAKVFEFAYTRFLDLQKAEAQAREAEIQLALERVRARTMAMHRSEELAETAVVLFQQLNELGVKPERINIGIVKEEERIIEWWSTEQGGDQINQLFKGRIDEPTTLSKVYSAWKNGERLMVLKQSGKELTEWLKYLTEELGIPFKEELRQARRYQSTSFFTHGMILMSTPDPLSNETLTLLPRFAKVFEQTYTRFLDLQKAEAQAREAQIEAALEKVRSRSMAMHSSEELADTASILFEQLHALGEIPDRVGICIINEEQKFFEQWITNQEGKYLGHRVNASIEESTSMAKLYKAWKDKKDHLVLDLQGQELKQWLQFVREDLKIAVDDTKIKGRRIHNAVFFSKGMFLCTTHEPVSNEIIQLLIRFVKVFEQAYTRFLDLQKAEAQAREAQIEAALERVRAKAMAMHNTKDISDATAIVFNELTRLGVEMVRCGIGILHDKSSQLEIWSTPMSPKDKKVKEVIMGYVESNFHPMIQSIFEAWRNNESYFTYTLHANEVREYYERLSKVPGYRFPKIAKYPDRQMLHCFYFEHGNIFVYSEDDLSGEQKLLLHRFTKVFSLTYKRYLDLKNAEAQVREAHIEAALERVRSRSMAMHKSDELQEVINRLFIEIESLGVQMGSSYIVTDVDEDITQGVHIWVQNNVNLYAEKVHLSYLDHSLFHNFYKAWWDKTPFYTEIFNKKEKNRLFNHLFKHSQQLSAIPDDRKKFVLDGSGFSRSVAIYKYVAFIIQKYDDQPFKPEEINIQKRFGGVFEQTYTRFLDLQKAEAQAREAQIEAALERVRARALAMHSSEELYEVARVLREQMGILGQAELEASVVHIYPENSETFESWYAMRPPDQKGGEIVTGVAHFPIQKSAVAKETVNAYYAKPKEYTLKYSGAKLQEWLEQLAKQAPKIIKYFGDELPKKHVHHFSDFSGGSLLMVSHEYPSEEAKSLQRRAASVFDLAYRRYLDLKQAEEQAREAQIEAALERVRSKTMAMHNSHDVGATIVTLFDEVLKLGLDNDIRCGIGILKGTKRMETWSATSFPNGEVDLKMGMLDMTIHPLLKRIKKAWKSGETHYTDQMSGKSLVRYYSALNNEPDYSFHINLDTLPKKQYHNSFSFSQGILFSFSPNPMSEEAAKILNRFARVFGQTYRRYVDLLKAEGQAREAQIEAALERIRAKALTMQSSADLHDVSIVLREQMGLLGQPELESSIVHLYNSKETLESWYTFRSTETKSEKIVTDVAFIPVDSCEYIKETLEKYNSDESEYTIISKGKKLADWYNVMVKVAPDTIEYDERGKILIPEILYYHHSKFSGGALLLISNQPPVEESKELQRRAARVFNFAYQRFLDLKKAEAQTREAQIEASLERIRAQAMAMQHSNDLMKSTSILFEELAKLELSVERSGIGIFDEETRDCHLWTTVVTQNGETELATGITSLTVHPMLIKTFDAWKSHDSLLYILEGKELKDYYKLVSNSEFHLPDDVIESSAYLPKEYYLYTPFGAGGIYVFSDTEPSKEEQQIIRRFAEVFHLTYTRYEDLQKAEERAFEAIKQASLDRIRAEIASMRTADDLQRITPLIWSELKTQGVPFIRCGVFIMDDVNAVMQSHLSTPDGKSLGVYDLPYGSTEIAKKLVQRWNKKKAYKEHWDKDQFMRFMETMAQRGLIQNQQVYQGETKPPESLDLHFVPFKQGMLYAGNIAPLSDEELQLVKSLAEAFSIAYARYEDFRLLEEAKNQTETAFAELKSTQSQLIQSEKMASLGELTAGIAHEIQNPLNFVNNFSEVSKELIEEMNEEMESGNMEEVKEITEDIKQNLDKIYHHGQRASSIVKGMLEHSRTGDRKKELTDINILADEYLRLAYHGLRAKDKTFNADFRTELEKGLPKISVIAQDISRVLLNMINNAFYAVSKKSQEAAEGYVPTVTISTKKNDKTIEIIVQDNGSGIPNDALDKIFQPFFTTKPTGEGTGLGLSLSYDIITKGHDGHLEVETEEGIGTRFLVRLPIV